MKSIHCVTVCLLVLFISGLVCFGQDNTATVEFVGTTPSHPTTRSFLGVAATGEQGEKIQWDLTLSGDPRQGRPATFKLVAIHGIQASNAPGFVNGGTTVRLQGTWQIVRGTKVDPDATVYQITAANREPSLFFVKLNYNLLHFLDQDKSFLVGDDSWSFLLNRKGAGMDEPSQRGN